MTYALYSPIQPLKSINYQNQLSAHGANDARQGPPG
jgi:hypothetical protein